MDRSEIACFNEFNQKFHSENACRIRRNVGVNIVLDVELCTLSGGSVNDRRKKVLASSISVMPKNFFGALEPIHIIVIHGMTVFQRFGKAKVKKNKAIEENENQKKKQL